MGYIMTEPKAKAAKDAGELSETAIGHLADIFVRVRYNRQTDFTNKYTIKGNMVEEDSLTLYSRYKKQVFFKNKEQLIGDYITGTPDIIHFKDNEAIIIDIKSSWDIFTFFRNTIKKMNADYYWQMQGYMALTGANSAKLAYCLVNTPDVIINDEKRRLFYKMGVATEENIDYQKACEELDALMIYDDIDLKERVIELHIDRNESDIELIKSKVIKCREYMQTKWGYLSDRHIITASHDKEVDAIIVS